MVVGFFVLFYTLISIPAFTNLIKDKLTQEISSFLGGQIIIDDLEIIPFNEIKINGLKVYDPSGEKCLEVETIGAGIRLWHLLLNGKIELSYGEIIGLSALIIQEEKDSDLNISFIINAFSKNNNPDAQQPFELAFHNIVLRKSAITFQRKWLKNHSVGSLDLSNLQITDLAADITFPHISNKDLEVDLRRLSFKIPDAIDVEKIRFKGDFSQEGLQINNFTLEFPSSRIFIPDFEINLRNQKNIFSALKEGNHSFTIEKSYITPSDFSFLWPNLKVFSEALPLQIEVNGNSDDIKIEKFNFGVLNSFYLSFIGNLERLTNLKTANGNLSDLKIFVSESVLSNLDLSDLKISPTLLYALKNLGNLQMNGDLSADMTDSSVKGNFELMSQTFNVVIEGAFQRNQNNIITTNGEINVIDLHLHHLFPTVPIERLNANIVAEGSMAGKDFEGMASIVVDNFKYKGKQFDGLSLNINKKDENIEGDLFINNEIADITAEFNGDFINKEKNFDLLLDIERLNLSKITDLKKYQDYIIAGNIKAKGEGSDLNDIIGSLTLDKFSFTAPDNSKRLKLNQLKVNAATEDDIHFYNVESDWFNAHIEGVLYPQQLKNQIMYIGESVFPDLLPTKSDYAEELASNIIFDIIINDNNSLPDFFNLPFRFLVPINIAGNIDGTMNSASLSVDIPYLQQGKDKLIYNTRFNVNADGSSGFIDALLQTTLPVKKGDLTLNLNLFGNHNALTTDIYWVNTENSNFKGHLALDTQIGRNALTFKPTFTVNIKPSLLQMGTADWNLSSSMVKYHDKYLEVDGLKIWNDNQFVEINGVASQDYKDILRITLEDIDVDYVFDMLQINYVTFGGSATGELAGHALLSSNPVAETEYFKIDDFSYNGALLGKCIVTSKWNNDEKEIEITADISNAGKRCVFASGGIWLGKDSLSFDIDADKVPVDFVQPFMSVFSSHVGGFASGDAKLFGTFHDIDMTGRIYADSVAVKLDYTNTIYHGSDSVYLDPGKIEIPGFRLYDKYGNSALLTGELTHNYFHDPSFTFRLSEARDLLCYDTNSDFNPDWYGTIFGNGSALIRGVPGLVDITADMTVTTNSNFTFVLNDTQYAQDYQFLTFSDKKGEEKRKQSKTSLTADDFKEMLKRNMEQQGSYSKFGIDIRATVTPEALFTLVMDPIAGDKITAKGKGAMQVKYESDNDEMMMYGKYEIDEGNYNFSLQDIILRDFKIKEGSSISFNGDPLAADLDISATYRVNTNLSDLDKSFSTDRDLNRTNVPVDAVLSVEGNMQHPEITFDIELPTLTQDVERKVKSIISTDDMMNRQIIYLLALNRFYTPEYMGASGNGGELAAVASSTISSQLSNILGQLTDKFSVSPSFRSDKGDFSDIEVDVALSSRLLNNRLLINGNFGYRDRSNSSTTFVGDFDVEYLLSKNGNLRLKAYNHFNDQNYYLREALTTQGLGVVYRRDFDDWFTFLKKKKKKDEETDDKEDQVTSEDDKENVEKDTNVSED